MTGDNTDTHPEALRVVANEGGIVTRLDLRRRERRPGGCSHSSIGVYEDGSGVVCEDCKASLNPVLVLEFAKSQRVGARAEHAVAEARAEAAALHKQVERMRSQVSRLKGQARALGEEPIVHATGTDCRCWQCVPMEIALYPEARDAIRGMSPQEQAAHVSRLIVAAARDSEARREAKGD